jgi:tetratricopeptide (TPR) repeat protein
LQAYTVGEEKRARENDLAAIPFFQRAIEIDPDFVTAYAYLGTIYRNTGDHRRAVEYQTKAFERRDRTSPLERFYIEARYYGDVTGEVDKEIATYELWQKTYPRDYTPISNLGETYRDLGDLERGLSFALEGLKIAPYDQNVYQQATSAFEQLHRFEEAKSVARKAIAHGLDSIDLHLELYCIAFAEKDTTEMQRQSEWARGRDEEWQMCFMSLWPQARTEKCASSSDCHNGLMKVLYSRNPRALQLNMLASGPQKRCFSVIRVRLAIGFYSRSVMACACRGPYSGRALGCCRYFRMVLRSQPVSLLIPWILIPCRCNSFSSCTSRPLSKSWNLLRAEWVPVYHARGGDFSTGTMKIFAPALTSRNPAMSLKTLVGSTGLELRLT